MEDRIDWADVAAVGLVAESWFDDFPRHQVRRLLDHEPAGTLGPYQENVDAIAAALREAHEAGLREGEVVGESRAVDHITSAEAEFISELRREMAARRAVDRWLQEREGMRAIGLIDGLLTALEFDDNGDQRFVAQAPDYPALAAALGLEVEDE